MNRFSHKLTLIFSIFSLTFFAQCRDDKVSSPTDSQPGLAEVYKDYFPIGVAVSPRALADSAESSLIRRHFNSMTAENVMKSGPIHPEPDLYNWGPADSVANFARENGMKLRGHALIWHNQHPDWFFTDENGDTISKEVLYSRMKSHIQQVVSRYKDIIYAWDVVNEAVSDQDGKLLRDSPFYRIAGEDYIAKAFQYAHEADPAAKLFYNDYSAISPGKRDRILELLKMLKDQGVPIHGVGLQGHVSIYEPEEKELREALDLYGALDLEVQITELDVSVHHKEHSRREKRAEDSTGGLSAEQSERQATQYEMLFRVFRDYRDLLTGVTFWNISDRHSWLDNFPVRGRKDYPLLFDEEYQPKNAYYKVVDFDPQEKE